MPPTLSPAAQPAQGAVKPTLTLNERQQKVVRRMLKEGSSGFHGGMSAKKYMVIAKTTKPTATRDLQDLVLKDVFIPAGGGRSTHYQINL
jgi:Fic family protein